MTQKDQRIVYSVSGTWWDSIDKVAINKSGLPCCPFCGSVLYQMDSLEDFMKGAKEYNTRHPGYIECLEWGRGKCFSSQKALQEAYNAQVKG